MFLGPFEEGGDYRDEGIQGPFGFLKRLWETVVPVEDLLEGPPDPAVERKLHQTIEQVTRQLPGAGLQHLHRRHDGVPERGARRRAQAARGEVEPLVVMIAPFCPHIAEELWARLGHQGSVFDGANWPSLRPGEARGGHRDPGGAGEREGPGDPGAPPGRRRGGGPGPGQAEPNVARHLEGVEIRRVIHVQDRLLNLVVG
jgi:leucyl-tRNA synthetase